MSLKPKTSIEIAPPLPVYAEDIGWFFRSNEQFLLMKRNSIPVVYQTKQVGHLHDWLLENNVKEVALV